MLNTGEIAQEIGVRGDRDRVRDLDRGRSLVDSLGAVRHSADGDRPIDRDRAISQAIEQLIQGDFQARWDAAKRLERWGEAAIPAILALGDRLLPSEDCAGNQALDPGVDEELLWFWAKLLGALRHPAATAGLIDLLTGGLEAVSAMAAQSLVGLGAEAVPLLLPLLDRPETRSVAILTLAQIPDPAVVEAVLAVVAEAPADLRGLALESLARQEDERVVAALIAGLRDPAAIVRRSAIAGLTGPIRSQVKDWVSHLAPLLDDPNVDVACQAAISLGHVPDGVAALTTVLARSAPLALKLAVIRALGWLGSGPAIDALGCHLDRCLGHSNTQPCQAPLDLELQIRELINTLGRISEVGHAQAAAALVAGLPIPGRRRLSLDSQRQWIWAAGQLRSPILLQGLIDLTFQGSESLYWHGLAALRRFDRSQISAHLTHAALAVGRLERLCQDLALPRPER